MLPLLYPMAILEYTDNERTNYRLFLFCGCWLLFFYTFISQMIGDFASLEIGAGAGPGGATVINGLDWSLVSELCLSGVNYLSSTEQKVLSSFGAAGSIFIALYGLLALFWFIATVHVPNQARTFRKSIVSRFPKQRRLGYLVGFLAFIVPVLTIPQFWGLMRLRGIQKAVALSSSSDYADNQWTFGQVTAVMLFVPLFVEAGYLTLEKRGKRREKRQSS
jgi:hypothetical protein